jgi:hypothetical protein
VRIATRRLVALVLIVGLSGCSTVQTVQPTPAEVCAQPGLWAVLARPRVAATGDLPAPLSAGNAAVAGAKAGAAAAFQPAATAVGGAGQMPGAAFLMTIPLAAAGVVLAPVTAIIGAGAGAASAHSEEEIAAAKKSMTGALDGAKQADALGARVVALAQEQAGRRVYGCGALSSLEACERHSPDLVTVVISIATSPPYFEVEGSVTPDVRLLLSADAEVVRASDGATLYRRSWAYRGRQHGYFDLAADDAKLFRAELARATDSLAAKVVDDLLIGGREEVHSSRQQPEGSVWTVLPPGGSGSGADCP